jgi:hypothetical protein
MMGALARPHWSWIEPFVEGTMQAVAKEGVMMQEQLSNASNATANASQQSSIAMSPEVALSKSLLVVPPVHFTGQDESEDGRHLQPVELVARVLARVRGFRQRLPLLPVTVQAAPEEAVPPAATTVEQELEHDVHDRAPEVEHQLPQVLPHQPVQPHQPEEDHPADTIASIQAGPPEAIGEGEAGNEPEETTETPPELERGA